MKNHQLYNLWKQIKSRCYNINNPTYQYYGYRGIIMQENWIRDFYDFQNYIMNLPNFDEKNLGRNGITLDRINNDGNYEIGNLRWVSMEIQSRNRRKKRGNVISKYIGVSYDNSGIRKKRWRSRISVNKKIILLGRYETEEDARNARNEYILINNLENFNIN